CSREARAAGPGPLPVGRHAGAGLRRPHRRAPRELRGAGARRGRVAAPYLSAVPIAPEGRPQLPLPPHLQRLRHRGHRDARGAEGRLDGFAARAALPPVPPRRLRPRAAARARAAPRAPSRSPGVAERRRLPGGTLKPFRNLLPALVALAALAGAPIALAQLVIEASSFPVADFRALDKVQATCDGAAPSFLCDLQGEALTLIAPTGELAAAFAKQQRGQNLNAYNIDANTNLVPFDATIPGLALLVDGEYLAAQDASGAWARNGDGLWVGSYTATYVGAAGEFEVERRVTLRNGVDTFDVALDVTRLSGDEPADVQLATPGIGRTANPTVKVGHGTTFTLNPPEQTFADPSYVSL